MNLPKLSKKHEIIKDLRLLLKNNHDENLVFTDDINIMELAINKGLHIHQFFMCENENNPYKPETNALINRMIKVADAAYLIHQQTFALLSQKENSIGLIALIQLPSTSLDDLVKKDFIVVCDHLENPGNLGTIYRTAESAQVDAIICVDAITKRNNPKLTAAARGCNLLIPTWNTTFEEAQTWLLAHGYQIYLGEPQLGLDYQSYSYQGKIAIIIGNERFGIHPKWYEKEHLDVFIPMKGSNNSLNVSVAASILIYEAMMKRNKKQG
jgi:TrmH family RNA methyltransferase